MSIENPRISDANGDFFFEDSGAGPDFGTSEARVLVAQADTGTSAQIPAPDFPRTLTIGPDGAVRLPLGVVLGGFRLDGADLVLVQADGTEIVIADGALRIPTFIIGEVEIPQEVLLAALDASGIDVAAGPDGSFTAAGVPQGSGANFDLPPENETENEGPSFTDLLGDTSFSAGGQGGDDIFGDDTNVAPAIISEPHSGNLIESDDNPGGVDADPVPVSGTIVFNDFNATDTHTIAISGRSLDSFTGAGTLTPAQVQALLDGFTLGATTLPSGGANGSIAWLYALGNDAVDFLAAGERADLVFTVTINDAQSSTSTTVAITVTGTNDIPVFESVAAPIAYTEGDAAGIFASGSVTFTDADLSDAHAVDAAIGTIAWKSADSDDIDFSAYPELDFDALKAALESAFAANLDSAATNGNTGSIGWTFNASDGLFDFLAKDETLVIEYAVSVDDGNGGTVTTPVTVTVTGTNDAPVVTPDEKRWTESEVRQTFDTGNALSINVFENDSDVDATDVIFVHSRGMFQTTGIAHSHKVITASEYPLEAEIWNADGRARVILTRSGELSLIVTDGDPFKNLADGEVFRIRVFYYVSDGESLVLTSSVFHIDGETGANPPVSADVKESGDVLDADGDKVVDPGVPEVGGSLYSYEDPSSVTVEVQHDDSEYGTFTLNALTGEWKYVLDNTLEATQALKEGEIVEQTFRFVVKSPGFPDQIFEIKVTIEGTNDLPAIAVAGAGRVDEDDLGGATASLTDIPLNIDWAADDYDASGDLEGTVGIDAVTSSAGTTDAPYGTSRGDVIKLFVSADGLLAVGYVGDAGPIDSGTGLPTGVRIVFTASVDPEDGGSYSFALHDTLDHPDADSEDEITLRFDLVVTDDHGVEQPHSFSVVVEDDVPAPSATPSSGVTLEESALSDPIDWASGDWADILADLVHGGTAAASGRLADTMDFGADGPAAGGGFVLNGDTGDLEDMGLTSNGDPIQYAALEFGGQSLVLGFVSSISSSGLGAIFSVLEDVANGNPPNPIEAFNAFLAIVSGGDFHVVFSLHTEGNGEYKFRLFDPLDHAGGDDAALTIDFSSLFAAMDGDGDTVDLPAGALTVTIVDDVPGLENLALRANSRIVHDETPGEQNGDDFTVASLFAGIGNPGNDPDVDSADKIDGALGFASSVNGTPIATFDAQFGADGPAAGGGIAYTLELNGGNGADSGLTVTGGGRILLYLENVNGVDMIVGRVESGPFAGDAAFAVTIRPDGTLASAQWLSLDHTGPGGNDTIRIDSDSVLLRVTLTDGDDDSVSETLDISDRIRFRDDGPAIVDSVKVAVEEKDLDNADPSAGHFSFSLFGQTLFDIDFIEGAAGSNPDGGTDDTDYRAQYPLVGGLLNTLLNGSVLASGSLAGTVDFGADGAAATGGFVFNANAPLDISGLTSGDEVVEYTMFSTPGGQNFVFGYVSNIDDDADGTVDAIFASLEGLLGGSISSLLDLASALAGLPQNPDFRLVFSLATDASGAYDFRLFDALDHDALGDGDTLTIDFSALFSAEDGDGDTIVLPDGTFTVEVTDDAPVARNDSAILDEDTTFTGNVLTNDTQGADGATLTRVSFDDGASWHAIAATGATPIVSPGIGEFTFQPDGSWSFVPAPDYNGSTGFTYIIADSDGDESEANVDITVNAVNDAPVFDPAIVEFALGFDDDANPLPANLALVASGSSPNTNFGGYSSQWTGDWTTQLKVWLDPDWAEGEGFDWSVAANGADGAHQRDFIFHVWKVNGELYIAASNNSDAAVNPWKIDHEFTGGKKFAVAESGWYTLEHRFIDDGGILKVELHLLDASGTSLWHETRTNAADTIGDVVGGSRYGWFVFASVADGVPVDGISLNLNGTEAYVVELADGHPDEMSGMHTVSGEIPFTDVDGLDTHTVTSTPASTDYLGTFTPAILAGDEATGGNTGIVSWTFTLDDAAIERLAVGETLTQVYTVEVRDNSGAANATDTIDVTITITGTNDAPVFKVDADLTGAVAESGDLALINEAGLGGKLTHGYTLDTDATDALDAIKAGATDVAAFNAAFAAIQAITGNEAATFAVFWEYLDANYNPYFANGDNDPINVATARLGIKYALYLEAGGMPLVDVIAKFTADINGNGTPDRAQSLHDNLLGNANGGVLTTRFSGTLLAELQVDAPDYLLAREWVSGYEADADVAAQMHADDMAEGYAPSATGQLTASDVDNGASWTFAVDDGAGMFSGSSTGTYGTLTVDADGKWTYVLDDRDPDTQALAQGVSAEDTFTVQVKDEHGATATETLIITVTGTNDAPVITGSQGGIAGADMSGGNLEPSGALLAKLTVDLSGLIGDGSMLPQVFANVVADLGGDTAQAIAVIWDYLDDNYVASGPGHLQVNKAFTLLGIEYARYLDVGGVPLTGIVAKFTADDGDANTTPERFQTLHDNLLGNITNGALLQRYLNPNNPDSVNDQGLYDALKSAIEGIDLNLLDRPYYDGVEGKLNPAFAWDIDHGYLTTTTTGHLSATDVDGDALTWSLPGNTGVTVSGTYGDFAIDPDTGVWIYTLHQNTGLLKGEVAFESFEVAVSDGKGGIDTITLTVSATGTNNAPVAQNGGGLGHEDTIVLIELNGTDADGNLDGFVIQSLPNPATEGTLWLNADGTGAIAAGDQVTSPIYFKPVESWSGTTGFEYKAIDALGVESANTATATVNVLPVVDTPAMTIAGVRDGESHAGEGVVPTVTALAGGGFVVTWTAPEAQGESGPQFYNIHARLYDADGNPVGDEFQVDTAGGSQEFSSVAPLADGGFVVTWLSWTPDLQTKQVVGRLYDADGNATSGEFIVMDGDGALTGGMNATVSALGNGFAVAWSFMNDTFSSSYVDARIYGADGTELAYFEVSTDTDMVKSAPSIAELADGRFVVTWAGMISASGGGIYGQMFAADGTPIGGEFAIDENLNAHRAQSSVAALADGGFVVTWTSFAQNGMSEGIYAQRYDENGAEAGGPFQVSTYDGGQQNYSSVIALADGGFVVTWESLEQDGDGAGIYGQRYAADGQPVGGEFRLNETVEGEQTTITSGTLAVLPDGRIVQVWEGEGADEGQAAQGVFFRLFLHTVTVEEDNAAAIPITVEVTDTDGSESIASIVISGIPVGVTLTDGTPENTFTATAGGSAVDITGWARENLQAVPPQDWNGNFELTVETTITDEATWSSGAVSTNQTFTTTIDVVVTPVNDAPVLVWGPVNGTVTEDVLSYNALQTWGALTFADPDGPGSISLSGGPFASLVSVIGHGGAIVSADLLDALENGGAGYDPLWAYMFGNDLNWSFQVDNALVQYLNTGQSIDVVYEFTVVDGLGAATTQQVTITINGVDDNPPVITSAPASVTVVEDFSFIAPTDNLVINGGFEGSNLDGWDVSVPSGAQDHYFSTGNTGTGLVFTTFNSGGQDFGLSQAFDTAEGVKYTISFTVSTAFSFYNNNSISVSWNGETVLLLTDIFTGGYDDFVTYSVDVVGQSDQSELLLSFEADQWFILDDIAVAAVPGSEHATGIIEFTDANHDESHSVSYEAVDTGYIGTFAVKIVDASKGDGSGKVRWTFSVDDALIQHLGEGESITQAYMVTIDDGNALHGGTDWQIVTVTIEGANDAAVITGDVTGAVTEGGATVFTGNLDHTDVDSTNANDLWRAVTTPTASANDYGTFIIDTAGNWTYTLDDSHPDVLALGGSGTLTDSFTVLTEDGTAQTVSITINGTNYAPTDISLDRTSLDENLPAGTIVATLSTDDSNGSDTHSYMLVDNLGNEVTDGPFTISGNQLVASESFNYEAINAYPIIVRSTDQNGLWVDKVFTITVNDLNDAPEITSANSFSIDEPSTSVATLIANDEDVGDTLQWYIAGGADADLFEIDADTGQLSFKSAPVYNAGGDNEYHVVVIVRDEAMSQAVQAITVTVMETEANQPPTDIVFSGNGGLVAEAVYDGGNGFWTTRIDGGTPLFTLATIDPDNDDIFAYRFDDGSTSAQLYSESGVVAATFNVNSSTGIVTLAGSFGIGYQSTQTFVFRNDIDPPGPQTDLDKALRTSDGEFTHTEAITLRLGTQRQGMSYSGADTINGSGTNNDQVIYGFSGDDTIRGGGGNDWIAGGAGNDTLRGGAGADRFVWTEGSGDNSASFFSLNRDIIQDYNFAEGDKIDLQSLVPTFVNGFFSAYVRLANSGGDILVEIDANGNASGGAGWTTIYTLVGANETGDDHVAFYIGNYYLNMSISDAGVRTTYAGVDPIILDLDGNGYAFGADVAFDLDGDGAKDKVAWNSSGDGILAYDLNGNGIIDDGTEMFTPWFDGGDFANGGEALASLDANGDGVIDMDDPAFANLVIWRDENADGITDAGELTSLVENGITSISAPANPADGMVDGQSVIGEGAFTREDGSTGSYIEVALETIFGQAIAGTDGDDVLAGDAAEDIFTGGKGADTFVVDDFDIADFITDFDFGEGDRIDLSALLDGIASTEEGVVGAVSKAFNGDAGDTSIMIGDTEIVRLAGDHTSVDVSVLFNDDLGNQATAII